MGRNEQEMGFLGQIFRSVKNWFKFKDVCLVAIH